MPPKEVWKERAETAQLRIAQAQRALNTIIMQLEAVATGLDGAKVADGKLFNGLVPTRELWKPLTGELVTTRCINGHEVADLAHHYCAECGVKLWADADSRGDAP